jgi:hypothetical protein
MAVSDSEFRERVIHEKIVKRRLLGIPLCKLKR